MGTLLVVGKIYYLTLHTYEQ